MQRNLLTICLAMLLVGIFAMPNMAAKPKTKVTESENKKKKSEKKKKTQEAEVKSSKSKDLPMINGKIDLMKADPSQVDLAKIHPDKLNLSKEIVKALDLKKWDLSKIDTNKVSDSLTAKWIQKVIKADKALKKTLSGYKPGELERLREDNLKWLEKPEPLDKESLTRDHQYSVEQIKRYAQVVDDVLLVKLRETKQEFNPLTSDEQFVRRIYLDAAGRIPTAEETQTFLSDRSPQKRRILIDKLLLSENYPSQMFNWVADMLRVRELKSNQGDNSLYQAWLIDQFKSNRPWNELVHDLLTAKGDLVTNGAVGWLVRDKGMPLASASNTLTTFLGANVSCAECHDHPFADYTQRNFYEMAAFFGSNDVPGRNLRGFDKLLKDRMQSVHHNPKLYTAYPEDYKYDDVKPGSKVTPAFPVLENMAPRTKGTASQPLGPEDFAAWLTNPKNTQFAATIANRVWRKTFGHAVMEPLTEMDDLDLADNPRLIKAIAKLMQDLDFDMMAFQRVLYNTRAYQAQVSPSPEEGLAYHFPGPVLRRMTAEQTWDSMVTLIEGEDVNKFQRDRKTLAWTFDVFKDGFMDAYLGGKGIEFELVLKEAGSMSNQLRRQVNNGKRSGKNSLGRASELNQPEADTHFLRQFGQPERELADGSSLEGGIPQVLMLMNGDEHKKLASPDSYFVNLLNRASQAERLDLMYLSFFSRRPNAEERSFITHEQIDLKDLTWMLMNSREFMFVQ